MRSWAANGAVPTGSQVGARLGTASKALRSCRMPEPRLIRTNASAWSGVETSLRRRRCRSTANSLPSAPTSSTTRATMRAFSTSSHRRVRCEPDFRLPFATGTDPLVRVPASDCGAQRPTSLGIERAQRRRTFVDRLGVRPGGCVRLPILPGRPISRSLLLIGEGPTLFGDQAKSPTAARFVDDSPLVRRGSPGGVASRAGQCGKRPGRTADDRRGVPCGGSPAPVRSPVRNSGDAVAPCLRSCLRPSPWYQRSALLFSWRPTVDLIKSQLLPAWPFSSVTLRYQQHFLRKLLTERAGYADLRDEVACEPAVSIREFRCGAVLGIPVN
jgi:hypothetical protein